MCMSLFLGSSITLVCLFFYLCSSWQYHTALIADDTGFMISLISSTENPSSTLLLSPSRVAYYSWSFTFPYTLLELACQVLQKKAVDILIGIALKLWTNLRKTDIFIIIGHTITENSKSIYLVSRFSQQRFVVFCIKVLHVFLLDLFLGSWLPWWLRG